MIHQPKVYEWGSFYENGTYECYSLFRSRAKITTYKSLKWHLLVIWYLNPNLNKNNFKNLSEFICEKSNGFVTFDIDSRVLFNIVDEVENCDLEIPPKNKLRKIIFNDYSLLTPTEKNVNSRYYDWKIKEDTQRRYISVYDRSK